MMTDFTNEKYADPTLMCICHVSYQVPTTSAESDSDYSDSDLESTESTFLRLTLTCLSRTSRYAPESLCLIAISSQSH